MVAPSTDAMPEMKTFQVYETTTRRYAIIAVFSALAIATSILFSLIPNLETITLVIFLVSLRYGFRTGVSTAFTIAITYEIIAAQIYGSAAIVLPFKLAAYSIIALGGYLWKKAPDSLGKIPLIITGASLAALYDLITTLGVVLWLGQPFSTYFVLIVVGVIVPPFFTPIHMLCNAILFQFVPSIQSQLNSVESPQKAKLTNLNPKVNESDW